MVSEADRDLLEAYLDDTLSPTQVHRLDTRLSEDAELISALDQLRLDRAARVAAFDSGAPQKGEVDDFVNSFLTTVQRQNRRSKFLRFSRVMGALAACVIVGFGAGWVVRSGWRAQVTVAPTESIEPAQPASISSAAPDARLTIHPPIHMPKTSEPGLYQVALIDETGKVIAVQRFSKSEDAKQFADDLSLYQARRQQVSESQALLVSDQF